MRSPRRAVLKAVAGTVLASIWALAAGSGLSGPTPAAEAVVLGDGESVPRPAVEVVMRQFAYVPADVTVAPGTVVVWVNRDPLAHNVHLLADPEQNALTASLESELVAPGGRVAFRFLQPGTYAYLCDPHPFMTGVVRVQAGP